MTYLLFSRWLGLVLGLMIIGCTTMTPQEKREIDLQKFAIEINDEVAAGRQMSARLLGLFGNYETAPELTQYVNLVGRVLAGNIGRPEIVFHFGILNTDEKNAFAAPGGYVFVTRGLLVELRSESELAAVLAHEIAHVNERHMYRVIMPKRDVSTSEAVVRMMSRGKSELGTSMTSIVQEGLKSLLETGLGRQVELESDEAALAYLQSCGYNPASLRQLVLRISDAKQWSRHSKLHPSSKERVEHMNQLFVQNGYHDVSGAEIKTLKQRFAKAWEGIGKTRASD